MRTISRGSNPTIKMLGWPLFILALLLNFSITEKPSTSTPYPSTSTPFSIGGQGNVAPRAFTHARDTSTGIATVNKLGNAASEPLATPKLILGIGGGQELRRWVQVGVPIGGPGNAPRTLMTESTSAALASANEIGGGQETRKLALHHPASPNALVSDYFVNTLWGSHCLVHRANS